MYIKMDKTSGKPVAHYELGDLLVSDFYRGDFIITGLGTCPYRFSCLWIDKGCRFPVEVDLRACPKGMFKPFMEDTGFYK